MTTRRRTPFPMEARIAAVLAPWRMDRDGVGAYRHSDGARCKALIECSACHARGFDHGLHHWAHDRAALALLILGRPEEFDEDGIGELDWTPDVGGTCPYCDRPLCEACAWACPRCADGGGEGP